jgi:hypothetical protein
VPDAGTGAEAPSPATTAASPANAATARVRRLVQTPPGFEKTELRGFTVLHRPEEAAWVRETLRGLLPATRPTTMPQDLLARVRERRREVETLLRAHLALPEAVNTGRLFDEKIVPGLQRLGGYRLPVFYLVITRPQLRDLIRSGDWSDPAFHYNRTSDEVLFAGQVRLSLEENPDDAVLPVIIDPEWSIARRQERLTKDVQNSQADLDRLLSGRAQYDLHMALADFIIKDALEPLQLTREQRWFAVGVGGYLSCEYGEILSGAARRELQAMLLVDGSRGRVRVGAVDLLDPAEMSSLRPQYVEAYQETFRRKSLLVVRKWLDRAGTDSLQRIMQSLRKELPATGADLVTLIRDDSGVDLSADVVAGK